MLLVILEYINYNDRKVENYADGEEVGLTFLGVGGTPSLIIT